MNIRKALTAVAMTAVFLCSNIAVNADYSDEYADKDYRHQSVYNLYGEAVKKPIAKFRITDTERLWKNLLQILELSVCVMVR
mgnify:CR=1 FL=1